MVARLSNKPAGRRKGKGDPMGTHSLRLLILFTATLAVAVAGLGRAGTALAVHCHSSGGVSSASISGGDTCVANSDLTGVADATAGGGGSTAVSNGYSGSHATSKAIGPGATAVANGQTGATSSAFAFGNGTSVSNGSANGFALACAYDFATAVANGDGAGSDATASAAGSGVAVANATAGMTDHQFAGGNCPPPQSEEDLGLADPNVPADVTLSQQIGASPKVGKLAWITITATNSGTNTGRDAYVKEYMPDGFQFVDCTTTLDGLPGGWCWWDGTNIVVDDFGDFAPGEVAVVNIFVRPTAAGDFFNTVGIGSDDYDPDSGNNFVSVPFTVAAA
jgi:uncharacterized repeat protein (TIGR01451 family)